MYSRITITNKVHLIDVEKKKIRPIVLHLKCHNKVIKVFVFIANNWCG